METQAIPQEIAVPLPRLIELCIEHWRIARWYAQQQPAGAAALRHALRKMEDFLKACDLEVQSLDGMPYDPGLAVHVVDAVEDPSLGPGRTVIDETLSPAVLYKGKVIRPADVVTRQGRGR